MEPDLWSVGMRRGSSPKMRALPEVGRRRPRIRLMEVVLPAPLGPSIATSEPFSMANETFFRASKLPYFLLAPTSSIAWVTRARLVLPRAVHLQPDHRRRTAISLHLERRARARIPL